MNTYEEDRTEAPEDLWHYNRQYFSPAIFITHTLTRGMLNFRIP